MNKQPNYADDPSDLTHTSGGHANWIAAARAEAAVFDGGMAPTSSSARAFLPDAVALRPMLGSRYQLGEEIRRGGQGVVYHGTQLGTRREVAIKVTYSRAEDTAARARFEREAQILAQLKHPNIVTIHETGGEGGSLYYVMDFIRGEPLDEYLRQQKRSPREIAAIFVKICDAVSIAHLRGVIHRDLKPSNIRVDPSGEPHVLDFGLAKISEFDALNAGSDVLTETGQFLGSVPWASPEQVAAQPENLDVRTDVYSIGVMLYQALTGFFPYPINGPAKLVLENICHFEPKAPSSIVKTLDDDFSQLVMKCLRKSPDDRYQSAGDVARELRRYLAGEPIEAKRDQTWYMLRKSAQRYRTAAMIASALLVAGIGSLAILLNSYQKEKELRSAAETAKLEADAARKRESEERSKAEEAWREEAKQRQLATANEKQAQLLAGFQGQLIQKIDVESMARTIMEQLQQQVREQLERAAQRTNSDAAVAIKEIDSEMARYASLTANVQPVDVLRRAFAQHFLSKVTEAAEKRFTGQPRIQSELLLTAGSALHELGLSKEAEPPLRRSLEMVRTAAEQGYSADREAVEINVLSHLAGSLSAQGRIDEAETLHRRALAMIEKLDDAGDFEIVSATNNVSVLRSAKGDLLGAIEMLRKILPRARKLPEEQKQTLSETIYNLGTCMARAGQYAESLPYLEEALAIRESIPGIAPYQIALVCGTMGRIYFHLENIEKSEPLLRRALDLARRSLGDDHPDVAYFMAGLAAVLTDSDPQAARSLYDEAIARTRRMYPDSHPGLAQLLDAYGILLRKMGDLAGAEKAAREALAIWRSLYGEVHPDIALGMNNLGIVLYSAGRYDEAVELFRSCMRKHAQLGTAADSDAVLTTEISLARCRIQQGELDDAKDLLETVRTDSKDGQKLARLKMDRYLGAVVELQEALATKSPGSDASARLASAKERLDQFRATTQPAKN